MCKVVLMGLHGLAGLAGLPPATASTHCHSETSLAGWQCLCSPLYSPREQPRYRRPPAWPLAAAPTGTGRFTVRFKLIIFYPMQRFTHHYAGAFSPAHLLGNHCGRCAPRGGARVGNQLKPFVGESQCFAAPYRKGLRCGWAEQNA